MVMDSSGSVCAPCQTRCPPLVASISMVLLIIILCISPTYGNSDSITIKEFPSRWDLPAPLELVLTTPQNYPYLQLRVKYNGFSIPMSTTKSLQCHVAIDNQNFLPITLNAVTDEKTIFSGRFIPQGTEIMPFSPVTWHCPSISLKRPDGYPHDPQNPVSSKIEIHAINQDTPYGSLEPIQSSYLMRGEHTIHDTPTFLHIYRLDDHGLVDITFTFYRPPSMTTFDEFSFDHPFLDVNSITTLHPSPESNPIEELGRLYYLHTFTNPSKYIECLSLTGQHAKLKYIKTGGSNGHMPRWTQLITIPQNTSGNKEFICSFQIQYPPSFLQYITSKKEGQLSMSIGYDGGSSSQTPIEIPLGFDTTTFGSRQQPPFYLSYYQHYLPMTSTQFELAIITPSRRFFETESLPELLDADFFFYINGENTISSSFRDWSSQIACRPHTVPMYPQYQEIQNGKVSISIHDFGGYGKVCHIKLQSRPEFFPRYGFILVNPYSSFSDPSSGSGFSYISPIFFYDTKLKPKSENDIYLFDTTMINPAQLPDLPPKIDFIKETNADGSTSSVAIMHLQPLVETKSLPALMAWMYIHLVFVHEISMYDIVADPTTIIRVDISIDLGNREMMSFRPDSSPRNDSANVSFGTFFDDHDLLIDPLSTIFQPNKRVHSPKFQIPIPLLAMGPSRPGKITLRMSTLPGYDMTSTSIYAYATVYSIAPHFPYMPQLALLTPVRNAPLTGYSYRCVTWDRMAASYVYGIQAGPITDSNSTPCGEYVPSIQAAESTNVSDDSVWKRVEYLKSCFYELAAVCVTPSTTVEGEYVAHPLADCPSFLGETHALPCSLVGGENEQTWEYSFTYFIVDTSDAVDPADDRLITLKHGFYEGDSRLELTVSLRLSQSSSEEDIDEPTAFQWVDVDSTIPAALFQKHVIHRAPLRVPWFDHSATHMDVRIQLNGHPSVVAYVKIMNPIKEEMVTECSPDANKEFDPATGLCRCVSGWNSTVPTGIDHPFVKPNAFHCFSCEWNVKTKQCEPNVPEQTTCHTIPPHVVPPFQTNACGFGVPYGENCSECTCLSRWVPHPDDNESNRCSECRLEYGTAEERCMTDHTDDISYTPEYCWVGRCLCKPGYYGDKCEHKVIYGTLEYTKPVEAAEPFIVTATSTGTSTSENEEVTILRRRQLLAVQDRIVGEIKTAMAERATDVHMFLQQATQRRVARRSDNIDDGYDVITTIVIGMQPPVDSGNNGDGEDGTPFIHLANGDDFSSLYDAWQDLQNSGAGNIPVDPDFGQVGGIQPPYDPHCVPNEFTSCPEGENNLLPPTSQVDPDELDEVYKEEEEDPDNPIIDISDDDDDNSKSSSNTTTYIIIGVVVGVVLLLFIALIVAIVYCRKHDKMCFRKRRGKGGATGDSRSVELANSNNNSKSNTASAPPSSSTMSTSSYLPTQVTVADPTLPADWIALEDKSTGKVYYSNKVTMESSWDHPAKPKEKDTGNAYGW